MDNAVAGWQESSHAWRDAESWEAVALLEVEAEGVVVESEDGRLRLRFRGELDLGGDRLPAPAAYSARRHLLAIRTVDGPVISIQPEYGVFGLLGNAEKCAFVRVEVVMEPSGAGSESSD